MVFDEKSRGHQLFIHFHLFILWELYMPVPDFVAIHPVGFCPELLRYFNLEA